MKILVIGSGGREHAIVYKLLQSKKCSEVICAPGNGGISSVVKCFDVKATDIENMIKLAKSESVDMVFVAPDDPLALGMVDEMEKEGIKAFGPKKNAAIIEASKAFSKELMKKYNIPTAKYEIFSDINEAMDYLDSQAMPIVIKADGLALGKGVIIAKTINEAKDALKEMMEDKKFGDSGNTVVIEEFMTGREVTVLAFADGKTVSPMISSQDHKRAYDNDLGLNTGGMGAFAPSKYYTNEIEEYCLNNIFRPTIDAMAKEGRPFSGVIYFGLMLTEDGPKVVEYNARLGDPETQVVFKSLKTDLVDIMNAIYNEKLVEIEIEYDGLTYACVVLASGGYPISYKKGYEIKGINNVEGATVFHAGTKRIDSKYYSNGGRVLCVSAGSSSLEKAVEKAYNELSKISFKDMHYRKDIGKK